MPRYYRVLSADFLHRAPLRELTVRNRVARCSFLSSKFEPDQLNDILLLQARPMEVYLECIIHHYSTTYLQVAVQLTDGHR